MIYSIQASNYTLWNSLIIRTRLFKKLFHLKQVKKNVLQYFDYLHVNFKGKYYFYRKKEDIFVKNEYFLG